MNTSTIRIAYALCAVAFVVIVARAYMNVKGTDGLVPVVPQAQVQALAREQLDALQTPSFRGDQELCGIIYETSEGELGVSRPREGDVASCDLAYFDEPGMVPVASFHTHGKHSRNYDGEVPSLVDIESDIASGIDGYVSTPGGRLWHIDHRAREAKLACGPGCLTQDPSYVPCEADIIQRRYTVETLDQRFRSVLPDC